MVLASLNHVLIETPAGITLQGTALVDLRQHLGDGITGIQPSVSWNVVVRTHERLRVSPEDLSAALRRWFSWEDVLTRAAHLLNLLGGPKTLVDQRARYLAELALADEWPAKIIGHESLLSAIAREGKTLFTMNEHGLFWILLDALREPWPRPSAMLVGTAADQRFARLVFMAADGMGLGAYPPSASAEHLPEGQVPPTKRAAFATAKVLIPVGRLNHHDHPKVLLVRSYELFVELLSATRPLLAQLFHQVRGMHMREWIIGLVALANLTETSASGGSPRLPILQLGPRGQRPQNASVAVVEQLARRAEHFIARLSALEPTLRPHELPTQALREAPIIELDEERFLVAHGDFLKAQADDGIFYALLDQLSTKEKGDFFKVFGEVIETYAARILKRCAAIEGVGGEIAKVAEAANGDKRCDFIWVLRNRTVYVEAKRLGLSVVHLHGRAELGDRLAEELGEACRQLLATRRAVVEKGPDGICSTLAGTPIPPRSTAVIITQGPTFAWFSTRDEVVPADIREEWLHAFGVAPVIWSLSELELLEAALPTIKLDAVLDAIEADEPSTYAGVAEFLTRAGYRGPIASPYYEAKSREILAERPQVDHPNVDQAGMSGQLVNE